MQKSSKISSLEVNVLGVPSHSIQLLSQKPVLCSTCGLDHGRIEVADGIFHSLQLLGYLTQEQDIQTVVPCCSSIPLSLLLEASENS